MTPLNVKIFKAFYKNRSIPPFKNISSDPKWEGSVYHACAVVGCPHLLLERCNKADKCVYLLIDTAYVHLTKLVVLNETIKPSVD